MSDIVLSAATRNSLLAAQNTATLLGTTQNRLATGKKVNSALDNAVSYFTAAGLDSRANDLSNLLDGISNGIQTIQAANTGISSIQKLVQSAQSTIAQAKSNVSASNTVLEGAGSIDITGTTGTSLKSKATSQNLGALGFATGDTIVVKSTKGGVDNTFTYTVGATPANETVGNIVSQLTASGVATAEVTDSGTLKLTATGDQALSITVASADASTSSTATDAAVKLGLTNTGLTFTNGTAAGDRDTTVITQAAAGASVDNTALVTQFNSIMDQISSAAGDASFNGVNLLKSGTSMDILFNEKTGASQSKLTISGVDASFAGLGLSKATSLNSAESASLSTALTTALSSLRNTSSTLGSNLSVVQTRQDFTKNIINNLQTGSSNLTTADLNEEAANSQALSTRQSLAISALSLANTAQQNVLQLLR